MYSQSYRYALGGYRYNSPNESMLTFGEILEFVKEEARRTDLRLEDDSLPDRRQERNCNLSYLSMKANDLALQIYSKTFYLPYGKKERMKEILHNRSILAKILNRLERSERYNDYACPRDQREQMATKIYNQVINCPPKKQERLLQQLYTLYRVDPA